MMQKEQPNKKNKLTLWIFIGLALGILVGWIVNENFIKNEKFNFTIFYLFKH